MQHLCEIGTLYNERVPISFLCAFRHVSLSRMRFDLIPIFYTRFDWFSFLYAFRYVFPLYVSILFDAICVTISIIFAIHSLKTTIRAADGFLQNYYLYLICKNRETYQLCLIGQPGKNPFERGNVYEEETC